MQMKYRRYVRVVRKKTWINCTFWIKLTWRNGTKRRSSGAKIIPVEVKSSANKNHESIDVFCEKYSSRIGRPLLISQKDVGNEG